MPQKGLGRVLKFDRVKFSLVVYILEDLGHSSLPSSLKRARPINW